MVALRRFIFKITKSRIFTNISEQGRFPISLDNVRNYAMIPKWYASPVFKKDEQEAVLRTEEGLKLQHSKIRPPLTDETSSMFHDTEVNKFINYIMRKGKKEVARHMLRKTFENVKRIQLQRYHEAVPEEKNNIELNPYVIFHHAVKNCSPVLQLTPMIKGGITYKVPVPVNPNRSRFLGMNWLIDAGKSKERRVSFSEQLAYELIDASNNTGKVIKRKQELHKQCEANRAYAHFRWF